jgi:hypothetical protein
MTLPDIELTVKPLGRTKTVTVLQARCVRELAFLP